LRWLLLLKEYGLLFEYLPGKKNIVADALSRIDIDSLMIQEEEELTFHSESENIITSNMKSTILMHAALMFREQEKHKVQVIQRKGLILNSLLNTTY
jgi:hypothetical protein